MKAFHYVMRGLVPVLVLALAWLLSQGLTALKPEVEKRPPEVVAPLVVASTVQPTDYRVHVESYGTVHPRTESWMVAEVSGRIVSVSDKLENGNFFAEGEELLTIDPRDYQLALADTKLVLAQARTRLLQEQADADVARREWEEVGRGAEPTPLVLREPQVAEAQARVDAAEAAVERAQRDLDRTVLRAPFAGRIRMTSVDLGQFVPAGSQLVQIYAVDFAEVRLLLPDSELAYVDLPIRLPGFEEQEHPRTVLSADFAGARHEWVGEIVRTEGEIDPATSMVVAICRVADPYGYFAEQDGGAPAAANGPAEVANGAQTLAGADGSVPQAGAARKVPLAAGLFVRARIEGRLMHDVFLLPREALHGADTVYVVDDESRLRMTTVDVLRVERDFAVVGAGLRSEDRIVMTPLEVATEGMLLRLFEEEGEE